MGLASVTSSPEKSFNYSSKNNDNKSVGNQPPQYTSNSRFFSSNENQVRNSEQPPTYNNCNNKVPLSPRKPTTSTNLDEFGGNKEEIPNDNQSQRSTCSSVTCGSGGVNNLDKKSIRLTTPKKSGGFLGVLKKIGEYAIDILSLGIVPLVKFVYNSYTNNKLLATSIENLKIDPKIKKELKTLVDSIVKFNIESPKKLAELITKLKNEDLENIQKSVKNPETSTEKTENPEAEELNGKIAILKQLVENSKIEISTTINSITLDQIYGSFINNRATKDLVTTVKDVNRGYTLNLNGEYLDRSNVLLNLLLDSEKKKKYIESKLNVLKGKYPLVEYAHQGNVLQLDGVLFGFELVNYYSMLQPIEKVKLNFIHGSSERYDKHKNIFTIDSDAIKYEGQIAKYVDIVDDNTTDKCTSNLMTIEYKFNSSAKLSDEKDLKGNKLAIITSGDLEFTIKVNASNNKYYNNETVVKTIAITIGIIEKRAKQYYQNANINVVYK